MVVPFGARAFDPRSPDARRGGEIITSASTGAAVGLTAQQVLASRAAHGSNVIDEGGRHRVRLALSGFWGAVPWMLEAAVVLQVVIGEYAEAGVVLGLLVFNAGLGFVQASRAQATLETLKSRLALTASVRRDAVWANLPAAELVVGDLVTLSLGAVVPADVEVIDGSVLVDESALTGESVPAEAGAGAGAFSGALIKRGEARATVTAIGADTRFGRSAELVRTAHVVSTQQKAILRVVRALVIFNGGITVLLTAYAVLIHVTFAQIVPLVLVAVLASIPVALPSMFTLTASLGARKVTGAGVLPTRLSALDEAGGTDVLCVDKTGTLTQNSLAVAECRPANGYTVAQVLEFAALASSTGGADPVDAAIRQAAKDETGTPGLTLASFTPFDPTNKMSSATVTTSAGTTVTVVKGAYAVITNQTGDSAATQAQAKKLEAQGFRVLAVASGPPGKLKLAGLVALSDPPRDDSAALIKHLRELGVRTVMVTGDAAATAEVVAAAVGIEGAVSTQSPLPADADVEQAGIYAGVLPEDKFALVKAFQSHGHIVAMCGDGVNDAPALRQAQMGIAVSTATDAAKSAAGIVLTTAGLGGVVVAIEEGRSTFQRILTYTMRSIINKVVQVLFLFAGLVMTGHAVITPLLIVLVMVISDFLAMSAATDNVRPSPTPNVWRIGNLTRASLALDACDLAFCVGFLAIGHYTLGLDTAHLQTMAVVILVFSGQAVFYVSRERRRLWASRPSKWVLLSSVGDIGFIVILASFGLLMAPLPIAVTGLIAAGAIILVLLLDNVKVATFRRLAIA